MTALRDHVVMETLEEVEVVYLNRETAKWWNARRGVDDTATFCGHYWIHDNEEGGPFKTRSSAIRDAYYRFVLRREPPAIGDTHTPAGRRAYAKHYSRQTERRAAA